MTVTEIETEPRADADDASQVLEAKRERSTIKFPYTDIRDAVTVAQKAKHQFGSQASVDQMAAALNQKVTSGAFRTKLTAAQLFGAVTNKRGMIHLTPLGHALADEHSQKDALVRAFMSVPLYKALYDKYQGQTLPQGPGLEAEIRALGVVENQADRARQAFLRSAEHAGLFWGGRDRLVVPATASVVPEPKSTKQDGSPNGDRGEAIKLSDDPLLVGLWNKLPASGPFAARDRERWLRTLAVNLDMVYGEAEDSLEEPVSPADQHV